MLVHLHQRCHERVLYGWWLGTDDKGNPMVQQALRRTSDATARRRARTLATGLGVVLATTVPAIATAATGSDADYVVDGTFTAPLPADPGNLHPHLTVSDVARRLLPNIYDSLILRTMDGEIVPWLATEWQRDGAAVTFTVRDDVVCADGSPLTASQVAANFEFVADPDNASPLLGVLIPPGLAVVADDDAGTVTLTPPDADPFIVENTGELMIVCGDGLVDPAALATAPMGTGMFELTEAAANDHYTLTRRDDYAWGPGGTTAADPGVPAITEYRVVENETTAVNLFLDGELNVVSTAGADRDRLAGQGFESIDQRQLVGEIFVNHAEGRPGADDAVRAAIGQALDFSELIPVVTAGYGEQAKSIAGFEPRACQYDAVSGHLPTFDPDAARAALDAAGWVAGADGVRERDGQRLSLSLIWNTVNSAHPVTAELITAQLGEVGIEVTARGLPEAEVNEVIFNTGDFDLLLAAFNHGMPSVFIGFLAGDTATNFSHIANADYEALATEAMTAEGDAICDTFMAAEQALLDDNDVFPYADGFIPSFVQGIELPFAGVAFGTTVRLVAG